MPHLYGSRITVLSINESIVNRNLVKCVTSLKSLYTLATFKFEKGNQPECWKSFYCKCYTEDRLSFSGNVIGVFNVLRKRQYGTVSLSLFPVSNL